MPPRRARDDTLIRSRAEGAPDRELRRGTLADYGNREYSPSQRQFQVSPDGRVLAYARPDRSAIHLLRRDGAEAVLERVSGYDARFTQDGRTLAFAAEGEDYRAPARRPALRPAHLRAEPVGGAPPRPAVDGALRGGPRRLALGQEHDRRGHRSFRGSASRRQFASDDRRTGIGPGFQRFCAARAGTRVVCIDQRSAWSFDGPGATPRQLPIDPQPVPNAELSPDGRVLAVATKNGLLLFEDDEPPQRFAIESAVQSVWFSPDGAELAWATSDVAVWRRGRDERRLVLREGTIAAMRFVRSGRGLLLSIGGDLVLWSPERDEKTVLTSVDGELLGADVFDGGLALWAGKPWEPYARRRRHETGG